MKGSGRQEKYQAGGLGMGKQLRGEIKECEWSLTAALPSVMLLNAPYMSDYGATVTAELIRKGKREER